MSPLTVAEEPVAVVTTAQSRRFEALIAAEELVARLAAPPLKPNGYTVDGYRAPTLAERTAEIIRVAAFIENGRVSDGD